MFKKRQKALNVELDLKRETKLVASAEPTDNALAQYHLATENEPPAADDRAAAKTSETAETTQPPTTSPPSQRVAEAPQQTHQYAGLLSRLGSALIDSCIIALVGAALMIVEALPFCKIGFSGMAEYLPDWLRGDRSIPWLLFFGWYLSGALLTPWLYTAFFESSRYQATLGKMIFNLKVLDTSHRPFTFWRSTYRLFLQFLLCGLPFAVLTFCLNDLGALLGTVWTLIAYGAISLSKKKQSLYDLITHRLVEFTPGAASRKHSLTKAMLCAFALLFTTLLIGNNAGAFLHWLFPNALHDFQAANEVEIFRDKWCASDLPTYGTKVVADREIKAGSIITADDLRMEMDPDFTAPSTASKAKEDSPLPKPRIIDVSELIGKRTLNRSALNDDVSFFSLSAADFKQEREKLLSHAQNHTLDQICKPIKPPSKFVIFRRTPNEETIQRVALKDIRLTKCIKVERPQQLDKNFEGLFEVHLSDFNMTDPPPSFCTWELLGKELNDTSPDDRHEITEYDITQSGIGYRATRAFPAGHIIKAEDLKEVSMDVESTPYSTISDKSLIVGKMLCREIPKDTLLKPYLLEWND